MSETEPGGAPQPPTGQEIKQQPETAAERPTLATLEALLQQQDSALRSKYPNRKNDIESVRTEGDTAAFRTAFPDPAAVTDQQVNANPELRQAINREAETTRYLENAVAAGLLSPEMFPDPHAAFTPEQKLQLSRLSVETGLKRRRELLDPEKGYGWLAAVKVADGLRETRDMSQLNGKTREKLAREHLNDPAQSQYLAADLNNLTVDLDKQHHLGILDDVVRASGLEKTDPNYHAKVAELYKALNENVNNGLPKDVTTIQTALRRGAIKSMGEYTQLLREAIQRRKPEASNSQQAETTFVAERAARYEASIRSWKESAHNAFLYKPNELWGVWPEEAARIIDSQKRSLDQWVDFFYEGSFERAAVANDSQEQGFPDWFKDAAIIGVTTMSNDGVIGVSLNRVTPRSNTERKQQGLPEEIATTAPFPTVDPEACKQALKNFKAYFEQRRIDPVQLHQQDKARFIKEGSANFARSYALEVNRRKFARDEITQTQFLKENLQIDRQALKPLIETNKLMRDRLLERQHAFTLSKEDFNTFFASSEFDIRADMKQQNVGDCYLVASIYAMSQSPTFELMCRSSMQRLPDGSWRVKVPLLSQDNDPRAIEYAITPADLLPQENANLGKELSAGGTIDSRTELRPVQAKEGLQVLEAAYIKAMYGSSLDRLAAEGGTGAKVLEKFAGAYVKRYSVQSPHPTEALAKMEIQAELDHFLDRFDPDIDMATVGSFRHKDGEPAFYAVPGTNINLLRGHAYTISMVDTLTQTVVLSNPWDTKQPIRLTVAQFKESFADLSATRIDNKKLFTLLASKQ